MIPKFSATRSKTTWKPRVAENDLPLLYCAHCGTYQLGIAGKEPSSYRGTGRSPVLYPPYTHIEKPQCCCSDLEASPYIDQADTPENIFLDYSFIGGFNNNSLQIKWDISDSTFRVDWVLLKTFTGIQLKYVTPNNCSSLIFAFAEEDAFVYCDKDPCEECVFRCKSGFIAYVCIVNYGIVRVPLDRMAVIGSIH